MHRVLILPLPTSSPGSDTTYLYSLQEVLSLMHLYSPLLGQNLNLASILPIEGALKVDLHYLWKVLMQVWRFADGRTHAMHMFAVPALTVQ